LLQQSRLSLQRLLELVGMHAVDRSIGGTGTWTLAQAEAIKRRRAHVPTSPARDTD
jgi:hypothetical protein